MTAFHMVHTCRVCGAETSIEQMVHDIIDDAEARRLLRDVLNINLVLGAHVLRYLRLHKPAKQGMRWAKLRPLMVELLQAIQAGAITRKGRSWQVGADAWRAAFEATFRAAEEGKLDLPLAGNAYLYEVAMRLADKAEAQAEKQHEHTLRSRAHSSDAATDIASLASAALQDKDPALQKIENDRKQAKPMPAEVRAQLQKIRREM
ncbi:MAG: hypothetical protein Q4A28_06245 [Brachymonas sp.]|nr:hypothetical protein [Brachymonas sp.]